MKISLRWLSRHVDLTGIEPKQILADLTMSTAEIEGLIRFGDGLEPFVVGHVRKRDKHPDADKLSVCEVDLGKAGGVVQIVCGAQNVAAGQRVVVVRPGDTLPERYAPLRVVHNKEGIVRAEEIRARGRV